MIYTIDLNKHAFNRGIDARRDVRIETQYRMSNSEGFHVSIADACSRDPLFFLNMFGYTYDPRRQNTCLPFILYDFQAEVAEKILSGITRQKDVCIEHSADMGISWLQTGLILWMWLFRPGTSTMFIARTESYLLDNPKGFFWRLRYMHERLPSWMQVDFKEGRTDWLNPSGSLISGETAFGSPGHGSRYTSIFIEDAWTLRNLDDVLCCTRDSTYCRIISGRGAGIGKIHDVLGPQQINGLRVHWSEHPEKGKGLYRKRADGRLYVIDRLGYPDNYEPISDGRLRSPWYDRQCRLCRAPADIAREIDIEL